MRKQSIISIATGALTLAGTLPVAAGLDSKVPLASEIQEYQKAAEAGDPRGMNQLGKCYMYGIGVKADEQKATDYFKQGAEKGDAASRNNLAVQLQNEGKDQEAVELLLVNAREGFAISERNLGQCYLTGSGVEPDTAEAFRWLSRAYEHGDRGGCRELGMLYLGMHGIMQDMEKAVHLFEEAEAQGDAMARMYLYCAAACGIKTKWTAEEANAKYEEFRKERVRSLDELSELAPTINNTPNKVPTLAELAHIFQGMVYEHDDEAVVAWWRIWRGCAMFSMPEEKRFYREDMLDWLTTYAARGNAEAWYLKGDLLRDDMVKYVRENWKTPGECFRHSAELGYAPGEYEYAKHLADNEKKNAEAVKWFKKAADHGYYHAVAQMAAIYQNGWLDTPKDEAKAEEYYMKGIANGDYFCAVCLGDMYHEQGRIAEACNAWTAAAMITNYQAVLDTQMQKLTHYADKGEPAALTGLYQIMRKLRKDPEAVAYLLKAAEKGDPEAENLYGICCTTGTGRAKDEAEGAKWAKRAAEHGWANGQYEYGLALLFGNGVPKDQKAGLSWLLKAAEQGDPMAQFEAAVCLLNGEGCERDGKAYLHWLEKAVENGHPGAHALLGDAYLKGNGVPKDEEKAFALYATSMRLGNSKGYYGTAWCLLKGTGCRVDVQQGLHLLETAKQMGHATAGEDLAAIQNQFKTSEEPAVMYDYACALLSGNTVPQDAKAGQEMMAKAADKGFPPAQYEMARMLHGQHGRQDEEKAMLTKSAEGGFVPATWALASLYLNNNDPEHAIPWLEKAADGGYDAAVDILVDIHERAGNDSETWRWHLRAAELPETSPHRLMSYLVAAAIYLKGGPVEKDVAKAVKYMTLAAGYGNPHAQRKLGFMYLNGDGVPKDPEAARHWLHLAACQGLEDAAKALEQL